MPDAGSAQRVVQTPEGVAPQDLLMTISSLSGKVIQKITVDLSQYAGRPSSLSMPSEPYLVAAVDGPLGFRCGTMWEDQHALRLKLHRQRCKRGPLCSFWGCSSAHAMRDDLGRREQNLSPDMLRTYSSFYKKATHAAAVCSGREFEFMADDLTPAKSGHAHASCQYCVA